MDADRQEGIDLLTRFQEFSNVYDVVDEDDEDGTTAEDASSTGMTIQEAARQLLMGRLPQYPKDDDDSNHVRIKVDRDKRTGGAFLPRKKSPVDLLWLPGDLQTQMRALATSSTLLDDKDGSFSPQMALEEMDRRAASDAPWWMMASDSSSDEEGDVSSTESRASDDSAEFAPILSPVRIPSVEASSGNGGFSLAALVASTRAPSTTAALVLILTALSLASTFADIPSTAMSLPSDDVEEDETDDEETS